MAIRMAFIYSFFHLTISTAFAQDIPIGTWRNHLSYQTARQIAILPDEIYCASANGLFSLDQATNSLNTLSKIEGLSENTISQIEYDPDTQTLVIAYDNSNIDLIRNQEIIELPLIKNTDIQGSKTIHHIYLNDRLAYLSSDLGLIILDIDKEEIRETLQNLGSNGSTLPIYAATISQDSLLLATAEGVIIASLNDNLQDFNRWKRFDVAQGLDAQNIREITSRNGNVYVAVNQSGIFKYTHQNFWEAVQLNNIRIYNDLNTSQDQILICTQDGFVLSLDSQDDIDLINDPLFSSPQEAGLDQAGNLWIADPLNGLLTNQGGAFTSYFPNGPARGESWSITYTNGEIIAFSGGFDASYNALQQNSGYYTFRDNTWKSFNAFDSRNSTATPEVKDLIQGVYNPFDKKLYMASFGQGLLLRDENGDYEIIDQNTPGSPLETDINGAVKTAGLARDFDNNLWITNHSVSIGQNSLHVLKTDGTWQSFPPFVTAARNPLDVLVDNNNYKWVRLSPNRGGGIWVLDDQGGRNRYLTSGGGSSGNLPSSRVNSIAQDKEGQIWIGTDEGVAVIFDAFNVFDFSVSALTPIFELRPLLRAEKVNVIAIDGGNRKWIGTDNGLWLFNPDGSVLLERFREDNSPLISNVVRDISIHPESGELFIATDKGIVSYRAGATEGSDSFSQVRVFPNPVRPDFEGLVGISGLVNNANVKITDVSGRLFFEGQAQGGTLTWNLRDYNGIKARTGIYLIFMTNADGSETEVTQIAVIE